MDSETAAIQEKQRLKRLEEQIQDMPSSTIDYRQIVENWTMNVNIQAEKSLRLSGCKRFYLIMSFNVTICWF
jgi:hypothetical protein